MIKIKRILGSERCYELIDGRKIPFEELEKLKRDEIINSNYEVKPKKKKIKKKRAKKGKNESGNISG